VFVEIGKVGRVGALKDDLSLSRWAVSDPIHPYSNG